MKWLVAVLVVGSTFVGNIAVAQSCQEVPISQMQAIEETTGKKKTPRHQTTYWPDFAVPMSIKNDLTYKWDGEVSCGEFAPVAENQGYYARWDYVGHGKDARGIECVNSEVRGESPKGQVSVTVLYKGVPSVSCEYTGWGAGQGTCTTLKPIMYGGGCDDTETEGGSGGWVIPASALLALLIGGALIARRKLNPLIMFEPKSSDVPEKSSNKRNCDVYREKVKACEVLIDDLEHDLDRARGKLEDAEHEARKEADELFDRGTNDVARYEGSVERIKAKLVQAEEDLKTAERDLEVCSTC